MAVLGLRLPRPGDRHDGRGLIAELRGAGDQRHRAHHLLQPPDRPDDLERQLRNAVAIVRQRQPFEHDVSEPAIRRCVDSTFPRRDQVIDSLLFRAAMHANIEIGDVERLAISPDAADAPDLAFAQPDREVREVGVGRRGRGRPAEPLAAG